MRKTSFILLPLLAIGLTAAEPAEKKVLADELEVVAGNSLTPEQKTALAAVDVRLAGVEALATKINDPTFKAEVARQIEDLKKRRLAIEKNFDPGLYETLMHSVISRYQVIALWLKPPALSAPPLEAIQKAEIDGKPSAATQTQTEKHPQTQISNEVITAKLYLPDPERGYYRGARFDWSGVIHSLKYEGHEYFGEWQQSEDPYLNDRITGPVESFSADAKVERGGTFVRIGVGVCERKGEGSGWQGLHVVNHGRWQVTQGANWIEMTQEIGDDKLQQGYRYAKRITLTPGKPDLVIDHVLTNTGQRTIETEVYNHNFFVIDGQPTGPDFVVRFPFALTADRSLKGFGSVRNTELTYEREIPAGEYIITLLTGYGTSADDHRFSLENRKTKAGVRMVTDRPLKKLQFWSPRTTVCPEPFIGLTIAPNQSDRWTICYTFYTLGT